MKELIALQRTKGKERRAKSENRHSLFAPRSSLFSLSPFALRPSPFGFSPFVFSGFTLIETTLALMILLFGLITLAQLFVVAVSNYTMARSQMLATNVAHQRMDNLAGQYQAGVTLTNGSEWVSVSNPSTSSQFSLYRASWTINGGRRGVQTVQVTAVPVEPAGASTRVNLKWSLNKVVVLRSIFSPVKH